VAVRVLHTARSARIRAALLIVLMAAAGCSGGQASPSSPAGSNPATSTSATTPISTPPDPHAGAMRAATAYLTAAATGPPLKARRMTRPTSPSARTHLQHLAAWLHRLRPSRLVLQASGYSSDDSGAEVGVQVEMSMRFGTPPFSQPVPAGSYVLDVSGGKVVSARSLEPGQNLAAFVTPFVSHGTVGTVIYGRSDLADEAQSILTVADAEAPAIHRDFGGGAATNRPVLLLVTSDGQLNRFCSCSPTESPLGLEWSGLVFVVLPEWQRAQEIQRRSVVVHELTHAGMRGLLGDTYLYSTSLSEGIAQYEEELYAGRAGYYRDLTDLAAAYRDGYDSAARWRSTDEQWGLHGKAVGLAYGDAFAITRILIQRHGGFAAFRKVMRGFLKAQRTSGSFTKAELERIFRRATGRSFTQISDETHAWVISGGWHMTL
jgi:hypothetical protein